MPLDEDFAASLAIIADAQKRMADTTRSLDATNRNIEANLHVLSRLHAYSLSLLVVGLVVGVVGLGGLCWFVWVLSAQHAQLMETLRLMAH